MPSSKSAHRSLLVNSFSHPASCLQNLDRAAANVQANPIHHISDGTRRAGDVWRATMQNADMVSALGYNPPNLRRHLRDRCGSGRFGRRLACTPDRSDPVDGCGICRQGLHYGDFGRSGRHFRHECRGSHLRNDLPSGNLCLDPGYGRGSVVRGGDLSASRTAKWPCRPVLQRRGVMAPFLHIRHKGALLTSGFILAATIVLPSHR